MFCPGSASTILSVSTLNVEMIFKTLKNVTPVMEFLFTQKLE